jgi:hypothetical protein
MGGFEKAVPRKLTHDVHVVVGEAEGWRFRRTAEPRPTGRSDKRLRLHADIIYERTEAPGWQCLGESGPDERPYERWQRQCL